MTSLTRILGTYEIKGRVVEYSIMGEGEPIMVMHGGHSNSKEEFGYENLIQNGYKIITPSRTGYGLTTPMEPNEARRLYAALLDHLRLDRVHLIGISAGGPSAVKMAEEFPDRFQTLTLQCAVTGAWLTEKDPEYKVAQFLFRPGIESLTWRLLAAFSNVFPQLAFRQMFSSVSTISYQEARQLIKKEDVDDIRKMNNRQRSGTGFLMDLKEAARVTQDDLAHIQCPTLIQKSHNDRSVADKHAYEADKYIPLSTLKFYNTWGHLIWLGKGSEKVNEDIVLFLKAHAIQKGRRAEK